MNREDILDSGRSAGDRAGGGSNMRSMPGSGGDMVDGGTSMERGRIRPMQGLGSATEADACTGFGAASARAGQGVSRNRENIDDARWGNGNRNNEEGFLMRNGSATTEAWTGLVNNDINFVWNHGRKFEGGFHCRYCNLRSRGGGATRFKEHLGHVIGEVKECPNVPRNIRDAMKGARNATRQKKREKATRKLRIEREIMDGLYRREGVINLESDDEHIQMQLRESLKDKNISRAVDASGQTQNSEFLYREIKKVVVEEIGHENVVQIVTDNGSNYKKACKTLVEQPEYDHIVWQPCAAHTVNLMLKDIAKFPEVDVIVKSAKQICRFFHNHNNLHDSMKKNVGGELIKPNATRFGTVFMFLQSYHEKKDQFRKWMVSDNWKECIWKDDPDYVFAEELLSSNMWWAALEWVLHMLEPLYKALRYADTQKKCTLSGFKKSMMSAVQDMGSHLGAGSAIFHRVMSKVSKRIDAMQKDTLMVAAAVLDPYTHYQINMSNIPEFAAALTDAIEKIADPDSAVLAIHEISTYRECRGRFGQRVARLSAGNMSPTEWWFQFGGEVPNLQKYALRIVSQCVSSSGCERNWSAFALVHTKQRNRLLYGKLHKCVSVRYNLRIRAEEDQDPVRENAKEKEVDPCAMMMDTTMFDESNPMLEWLNEDGEHTIFDGSEAASAVFEKIRSLNSSRKENHLGRKDNSRKRTRAMEEEEEDAYNDSEDDEEEENEYIDVDDDSDNEDGEDDSASEADGEVSGQAEKDGANQVRNVIEGTSDNLGNRRSGRVRQAKKVKDVNSLYY